MAIVGMNLTNGKSKKYLKKIQYHTKILENTGEQKRLENFIARLRVLFLQCQCRLGMAGCFLFCYTVDVLIILRQTYLEFVMDTETLSNITPIWGKLNL